MHAIVIGPCTTHQPCTSISGWVMDAVNACMKPCTSLYYVWAMDAVNSQRIAEYVRHAMHYMDGPWILYMGVHAASDHGTSSYIGLMDAVTILECIMPGPWMRQEPVVNPGLHKAGRSNRNDDVESKPRMAWGSPPSAPSAPSSAQRAQYTLKLRNRAI